MKSRDLVNFVNTFYYLYYFGGLSVPLLSDRTAADIEGQSDQRAPVNNFQNKIIERIQCSFSIEV